MWCMREKILSAERYLFRNRSGFISVYFLSVLLYCTAIVTIFMSNDRDRLITMMNMKANAEYTAMEIEVLSDFKCRLMSDELEEGFYETVSLSYEADVEESSAYLYIYGSREEILIVTINTETKRILEYETVRDEINVLKE